MQQFHLPPIAEFTDRRGFPRPIHGCSALGGFQFADRISEIYRILEAAETNDWRSLYVDDVWFRHHCNHCLELFSIDLDWVTLDQLGAMLFNRTAADGTVEPGILWVVGRDFDRDRPQPAETKQPLNPGALVDSLMASGLSGEDALLFAGQMPVSFLNEFMEARSDRLSAQSPDGRQKLSKSQKADLTQAFKKMKVSQDNGGDD
jgi:hypothetical protein